MKAIILAFTLFTLIVLGYPAGAWWSPQFAGLFFSEWRNEMQIDAWAKVSEGHALLVKDGSDSILAVYTGGNISRYRYIADIESYKTSAEFYKVYFGFLAKRIQKIDNLWFTSVVYDNKRAFGMFYFGENDFEHRDFGKIHRVWVAYDDETVSNSINPRHINASHDMEMVQELEGKISVVDWANTSKFCFGDYCFLWGWKS